MIEPAIVQAIASGVVPPEITAAYLMENRNGPSIAALIFLTILTVVIVGTRCVSRRFIVKYFGLDDYLALLSLPLFITFVVFAIVIIMRGAARHIEYVQYIATQSYTDWNETLDFIAHYFYTTSLFICRMSGLAFYRRLCMQHKELSVAIKAGAVFLVAVFIIQLCLMTFHCSPVSPLWRYFWEPVPPGEVCLEWGTVYSVNTGLSLVCDVLLFTIPVFIIRSLKASTQKKIKLSFVLFPGILVIAISIVRIYLVVIGQWLADGTWIYGPTLAIETAEISGTLIALSVPGLKPLVGKWFDVFHHSEIPTSNASPGLATIGSVPSRKTRGRTKLGSEDEEAVKRVDVRDRGVESGDDDCLVDKERDQIQVRTSLHVDSHSTANQSDIQLASYPRNWEQNSCV